MCQTHTDQDIDFWKKVTNTLQGKLLPRFLHASHLTASNGVGDLPMAKVNIRY